MVEAGLFNPKRGASAETFLNGASVATVTTNDPASDVWLLDGNNTVVVALSKKLADAYAFAVQPGICTLPRQVIRGGHAGVLERWSERHPGRQRVDERRLLRSQ